jgi:tripartite-type tricarboxylate transporter receptor subunit TctC
MVRGLAISSKQRSPVMPNLPTVSESGIPGLVDFDVTGWNGIVVKAGTPPDRIRLLSEHIKRALDEPDVVERIAKLGAEVAPSTPEEFGAFMRAEDKKWGDLVKKADLKID